MSDFLTRLALRQLRQIATIEPRVAPLYGVANQVRHPSFAEDSDYRPMTNTLEEATLPDRKTLGARGRLPAHVDDPVTSAKQPLVPTPAGSHEAIQRIDDESFMGESRINEPGPFTVEASASNPTTVSAGEPLDHFPRRQTEPGRRESLLVVPMTRIAPVAPMPLVKASHSGLTEHSNEFPPPVGLGSEEDRQRAQTRGDKEPAVHVTIGRIEVTAMTGAAPTKRAPARKQTMSLDDYLARRQRRDR